jgi:uncharacterized protein YkwD
MKRIAGFFRHFFTPNENNNYRAKALHHDYLTYYLLIALLLVFSFKKVNIHNVLGFATDISANKLFELTNSERVKNNLSALNYNEKLSQAAYQKGQDMFQKIYWAHYAPDGKAPWDFILGSGYQYEFAGENLAKNFLFSQAVIDGWMNSPTHKENILRGEYTDVGFAVVNGVLNGEETTLVVQMFGKPLPKTAIQTKTNSQSTVKINTSTNNPVIKSQPVVLSQKETKPTINILNFSVDMTYIFIFTLLSVLLIDFYIASKMKIVRFGGKNLAHFIFLIFILIGISFIISHNGLIL